MDKDCIFLLFLYFYYSFTNFKNYILKVEWHYILGSRRVLINLLLGEGKQEYRTRNDSEIASVSSIITNPMNPADVV